MKGRSKMIIGVCGHGASGASAMFDVLKEFEELQFPEFEREFPIAYAPDGLLDLENHLMKNPTRYYGCDIAIKRFLEYVDKEQRYNIHYSKNTREQFSKLSKEFIEEITQVKWRGYWYYDFYFHSYIYDKIRYSLGHRIDFKFFKTKKFKFSPDRYMHVAIKPDNFYKSVRKFINKLLNSMNLDPTKKVVLDQPYPYNNPESCFPFFEDPISIVVNRDPRDIYVYFKEIFNELWVPTENVEDFITYYRAIRNVSYSDNTRIMTVNYEDIVFNYEEIRKKIVKLLDIKNPCVVNKKRYFNPEISVGNLNIYKNYPQYQTDIKKIESDLAEFLYDFPDDWGGLDPSKGKIIIYTDSQKKK